KITVTENLADYVQNGVQHYVFAVASIDVNGNITDLRPKGTLNEQQASDALKKHEQSRNHPDATTSAKGFTQLSSATDSASEGQAATPKAVKIAMDNANARLAKERNGADIPNPPLFVQNIGLQDTVNKAAGALQKDQNGADIPDKDLFVRNVGAARAVHYAVHIGGAGDWTTAEFITWLESQGAFNHPYWMCKGSWSYANNRVITDTGCGNIQLAGAVVEVMGDRGAITIRVTTATTGTGTLSAQFTYVNHGDDYLPGWRRDFNTVNKPTSSDVGALPITGGTIGGDLKVNGFSALTMQINNVDRVNGNGLFQYFDLNNKLAFNMGYYRDTFNINFYDENGAWQSGPFNIGRNGNATFLGNVSCGAVFDAGQRVYSPNNPQPVSFAGYATQTWVLQNFVNSVRYGAQGFYNPGSNRVSWTFSAPSGHVLTGIDVQETGSNSADNIGGVYYRPLQKLVNGTWYNVESI
ncbi:MAG: phage tail protein, partial [Hafnia sp.]